MQLDPAVQEFVDAGRAERMTHLDIPGQRHYMRLLIDLNFLRFSRPGPAVHTVTDHAVAVDGGTIRCRVYRPGDHTDLPAHVALHGGGWTDWRRGQRDRYTISMVAAAGSRGVVGGTGWFGLGMPRRMAMAG